jgi:hypothetical protein
MEVLFEKPGYKILINPSTGDKAVQIDEAAFSPTISRDDYRIIQRRSDGERFLRTRDMRGNHVFGHITEVTETSQNVPVIKFITLPDEFPGIMIKGRTVVNSTSTTK